MAAVLLTGIDIADMHLDDGSGDGGDGIVDGHAGVAVAPGVEDDALGGEPHLVQAVDNLTLDVALVVAYLYIRKTPSECVHHLLHSGVSIDGRLALAGEVQIRSVDDFDMFHG